jgi:hypothetical protein
LSDISKTIRDKGFVTFYCQVSDTGSVYWASSFKSDLFSFYSFWNKKRKVLKFGKFDEKRAITPW